MRFITLAAAAALFAFQATAATFFTFQVPGCQGTQANAINDKGVVVGTCGGKGFIRDERGRFTTFAVVGAIGTGATAINNHGEVTGTYAVEVPDFGIVSQGFVRSPQGVVTTFSSSLTPGIGTSTFPTSINDSGQIVGTSASFRLTAFVRNPDGTITVAEPLLMGFKGSEATGINNVGEISGVAFRVGDIGQAFIRDASGNFTIVGPINTFDTWAIAISDRGSVLGTANGIDCAGGGMCSLVTTVFTETATGGISNYTPSPGTQTTAVCRTYG